MAAIFFNHSMIHWYIMIYGGRYGCAVANKIQVCTWLITCAVGGGVNISSKNKDYCNEIEILDRYML